MAASSKPTATARPRRAAADHAATVDGTGGRLDRLDVAVVAALLVAVTFAWCSAYSTWTAAAWSRPIAYHQADRTDVLHALAMTKAAAEGNFLPLAWKTVPDLGAPEAGNWNDWPFVEELQVLLFGVLARLFGLFAGLNAGFLVGHLLAAACFYLVVRSLGGTRPWSFVGGLAYGLAPYLFAQTPQHITAQYAWHVPLFLPVWRWVSTGDGLERRGPRFRAALAIGFLTGLQSPYFTNILCQGTLLGAAVVAWRRRSTAPLVPAFAVVAAAAASFAIMNVDTLTYRLANGPNQGAVVRAYAWLEVYGLKLVDLIVPLTTHRSAAFASFAAEHRRDLVLIDEGSYLGIVGIAALVLLVAVAVGRSIDAEPKAAPAAAWQTLWIVLCFTTGGLNAILGTFGLTLFRAGCRASIAILAIALAHAVLWLSDRPSGRRTGGLVAAGLLGLLVLWDQVPRPPDHEQAMEVARRLESDRAFVAAMERALPERGMVFQFPVVDFPEALIPQEWHGRIAAYDGFRPYLHASRLRFSFGTSKGRAGDRWRQEIQGKIVEGSAIDPSGRELVFNVDNVRQAIGMLRERGFSALVITVAAFPDQGAGLAKALHAAGLDRPPFVSGAGDLLFVDVRPGDAAGSAAAPVPER